MNSVVRYVPSIILLNAFLEGGSRHPVVVVSLLYQFPFPWFYGFGRSSRLDESGNFA